MKNCKEQRNQSTAQSSLMEKSIMSTQCVKALILRCFLYSALFISFHLKP